MAEGWLIQESLVYISEFLGQVDNSLPQLWSNEEDLRMTSIVPQDFVHYGVGWILRLEFELVREII